MYKQIVEERLAEIFKNAPENMDKELVASFIENYCDKVLDKPKVPYIPYPIALHTVDICLIREKNQGGAEILLGRKKNKEHFQIIGGFVESGDTAEKTVIKETLEETNIDLIEVESQITYWKSFVVDDERYRGAPHNITTSVFVAILLDEVKPVAGDDIVEVKWFDIEKLSPALIYPEHYKILTELVKKVNNEL